MVSIPSLLANVQDIRATGLVVPGDATIPIAFLKWHVFPKLNLGQFLTLEIGDVLYCVE